MKVVLGTQYGDEGKGRVVDLLARRADYVIRYQGGANSGHTVIVKGVKYVLHLIPSGIVHIHPVNLITNGVAFNLERFLEEKAELEKAGIKTAGRLFVSDRAGILFPWHKLRDQHGAKKALNTTGEGVGPFYEDNANRRRRINVGDLINHDGSIAREHFSQRVREVCALQNEILAPYKISIDPEEIITKFLKMAEEFAPYVADTSKMILNGLKHHLDMLFEGAQAVLLDRDLGDGRFVTSSNTGGGAIDADTGVPVTQFGLRRFGVLKAYTTRVGDGPFVTEDDDLGKRRRDRGKEYGATTGRPRRMGWLDMIALRYAVETSGIHVLVLTKPDVLDGESKIPICVAYELDGKRIEERPTRLRDLERCKPIYEVLDGWDQTEKVNDENILHPNLKKYIEFIEKQVGVRVAMVSTGPERSDFTMLNGFRLNSLLTA